jgi:hypothetical protein
MLKTMMTGTVPRAADPAAEDQVTADDLHQAHGTVRPGTKESHSCKHNSFSEGPASHTYTALKTPPPKGQMLG